MIQIFSSVHDRGAPHLTPVVVYEDVAHDCEHPTLEIDIVYILCFIVKDFERCVLYEVLCCIPVGGELTSKIEEVSLKPQQSLFE